MSVEKLNRLSKVEIEANPYSQVLNKISDQIKDNDAFRIYCYLSSKSPDWEVVKNWTAKHCLVSASKAKKVWAYLERCGLIEYVIHRDKEGKILKYDLRVLNGSGFNPYTTFLNKNTAKNCDLASGLKTAPLDDSQWSKNPPTGETTPQGFDPLLNKDLLPNKDLKTKKEKSFYREQKKANAKRYDFADSMDKNANEKKHIEQHEQIKRAPMPEYLREMCKNLKFGSY